MLILKTPAKINWFLHVLGKREDGYHEILSLMQTVSLYDYLTFEYSDEIEIITDADISKEENLVYKAAVLLREELLIKGGAAITLKKEIPMAAGLGGGSSDAACTLVGLNRLWNIGKSEDELAKLSGRLGSDIPFFFKGPLAIIEGRGETVTPLKANTSNIILLVKPPLSVSAKWAYTEFSKILTNPTKRDDNTKFFYQALNKQDFQSKASLLRNDLEIPVIREFKVIGEIKERLIEMGAWASLMSGSGPTVFSVFESREKAEKAAEAMKPNWTRIVETLTEVNSV